MQTNIKPLQHTETAPAKINAYLNVTGRREDGYHTILIHMQAVSLADTLTLSLDPAATGEPILHCDDERVPLGASNLVCRAALALENALRDRGRTDFGRLEIWLTKRIPMAAGLGGGSADAAAALRGYNALLGSPLTLDELARIGARLGADIPFCVYSGVQGGAMTARGIGELLTPVAGLPKSCALVVACHGPGVSTPAAYRRLDELGVGVTPETAEAHYADFVATLAGGDLLAIAAASYNCFETAVLPDHAEARALVSTMDEGGAVFARMSGSGPSVVGYFADESAAIAMADKLQAKGIPAYACRAL